MGEKREYKQRKPGGGRKKLKLEYDAGKNLKEQMVLSGKLNDAPSGRLFRADLEFLQRCPSL